MLRESINQIVNMTSIYLCTLPVNVTSTLCVFLCLDALYRAYQLRQPNTVTRRDRQVKMDMTIDFICVALPLGTLWFLYKIPISIMEIIQVALWPSFCLHSKTRSLLREAIRVRTENVMFEDRRLSAGGKRCKKQQSVVPPWFSNLFCLYNVLYGVFFLGMALAHIAMQPAECDEIWSKGCENKIPFCTEVFTPSCNCASLKIENNKSLVTLPDSLVDNMQGLRKVFIRNCNLTALPPRMEELTEMVDFEVSFNRLQRFDVDVGKWEKLNKLYLMYNEISFVHDAVWKHLEITALGLGNNTLILPSKSEMYMPSLTFLDIADNNMTVRGAIGKDSFPLLTDLYIHGNFIEMFPSENLKDSLVYLGVSRCGLNLLPSYLSMFKNLKYLDARDNQLSTISEELKHLLRTNDVEAYFAGNVVFCDVEEEFDCGPLCSNTCLSKRYSGDGFCDVECNTEDCKFDGGDCNFQYKD